jgi:hypothetical protein
MGTTLTGTTPQDTYDSLIKVTDNGPLGATVKYLSDGLGNDSALALSTSRIAIGSTIDSGELITAYGSTEAAIVFQNSSSGTGTGNGLYLGTLDAENYLWTYENQDMIFGANNTERMRILSGGGLTFNGDTAAANALDDYEEGTWTPTTATAGYTINTSAGSYTKIGRQVTFRCVVNFSAVNAASNSFVVISGLPFSTSAISYSGIVREDSNTGVLYACTAFNTSLFMNSMDGTTTGSQRPFATNENYVVSITYFV